MVRREEKGIVLSRHARERLVLRGAVETEVAGCIHEGAWEPAKRGKWHAAKRFAFDAPSPATGTTYRYKTVDVVFVEEDDRIVVVTVKVFFHDE